MTISTESGAKKVTALDKKSVIAVAEHLTGKGRPGFEATGAGRLYVPLIAAMLEKVKRPAPPKVAPVLLADPLREHTDGGNAIWWGLSAITADRSLAPEIRDAARAVRDAIGAKAPNGKLRAAERVAEASAIRGRLIPIADRLDRLPPTAAGQLFRDAILAWCDLGAGLTEEVIEGAVARKKAAAVPPESLERGRQVSRLNTLINHARMALRDEMEDAEGLPTLDAEIFGLYDSMLEARQARADQKARRQQRGEGSGSSSEPAPEPASSEPSTSP